MVPSAFLSSDDNAPISSRVPYRKITGQLLYLACTTRPDITAAVGAVCRFNANPGQVHWAAVKRIIQYLKGTINLGICLRGPPELQGWADANWASDPVSRRSTTGYLFKLGESPISWATKLQPTVALSSCEAEYISLAAAAQEAMWLTDLLNHLNIHQPSMVINEDNQGTIELTRNTRHPLERNTLISDITF